MKNVDRVGVVWLLIEDGKVIGATATEAWASDWASRARTHKRETKQVPLLKPT